MKKIIALILIISILILILFSCGNNDKLSGTYVGSSFGFRKSYTFDGDKVTVTDMTGIPLNGTYKIDGDTITIKTWSEFTYSFEKKSNNVILIDGIEFTKNGNKKSQDLINDKNNYENDYEYDYEVSSDKTTLNIINGRDFSDGVAWIKQEYGWSCVDKEGKIIFNLNSGSTPTTDFINGIAIIDKDKIINKSGEVVSSVSDGKYDRIIEECGNFNGYVFVCLFIDTFELTEYRIGIIDSSGNWYMEPIMKKPQYSDPRYVSDDMYYWEQGKSESRYYFNVKLKELVEFSPVYAGDSYENGYILNNTYQKVTVINKRGEYSEIYPILNNGKYTEFIGKYQDDVFFGTDLYVTECNFYNIYGDKAIDLSKYNIKHNIFDPYPYFSEGYCFLEIMNNQNSEYFTIIDKTGQQMFEPRKSVQHGEISCGLIWIKSGTGYSYIDVFGNEKFYLECSKANDFHESIAKIENSGSAYYIDINGNKIF